MLKKTKSKTIKIMTLKIVKNSNILQFNHYKTYTD